MSEAVEHTTPMLFRLIVLVLVCICCLAMMTSCTKEALTPCQKPPDNPHTSSDKNTSHSDNANTNTNANTNSSTSKSRSLTSNGETQYYIDPKDGKYKVVPEDPNQLPADTTFLAVDDKGNLVQADVNGIPSASQAMTEKDKADKDLARAKLQVKNNIAGGAAKNIVAANDLLYQQFDANQQNTNVLTSAQEIQANTEKIITDQQQRVAFQQGNMGNMIYELRLSTNEAEQAATILKQAAKIAMAKATKAAGPAPGPAPGPSTYMSKGPAALGPASNNPAKQVATDVNVCRSDELYGLCSNEMLDPPGKYVATVRDDGDFVVTATADKTKYLFSTETKGKGKLPYRLFLLQDSNLALYDADNTALWISGTSNLTGIAPPYRTKFVDGSFCVLDASSNVVWNSNWVDEQKKSCRSDRFGGVCNKEMFDASRAYVATIRDDGDFVVTTTADKTKYLFSTETKGKGSPPYRMLLLPDGNLVLYDASNTLVWESKSSNVAGMKAPYRTKLVDGSLNILDVSDKVVWNSYAAAMEEKEYKRTCRSDRYGGLCNKEMVDGTGKYIATMREDGALVTTTAEDRSKILYTTNSAGKGKPPYRLFLQNGGTLVIFDADNTAIWQTKSSNLVGLVPPYKATMTHNAVNIYDATDKLAWSSSLDNGTINNYYKGW